MSAALVFLRVNGVTIPQNTDVLHQAMLNIAARRLDRTGLATLFRQISSRHEG